MIFNLTIPNFDSCFDQNASIHLVTSYYTGPFFRMSWHLSHLPLPALNLSLLENIFKKNSVYLFGCAGSSLRHVGSSLHHMDLSLQFVASLAVVNRLSYSYTCGILVPQPGIEPVSPAFQGGFLSTGPPGKSLIHLFSFLIQVSPPHT